MLTLTSEDLSRLTGRNQPAAQIRWLKDRDWVFEIGADWLPKVARAYFERKMVLGEEMMPDSTSPTIAPNWQVNIDSLRPPFKS